MIILHYTQVLCVNLYIQPCVLKASLSINLKRLFFLIQLVLLYYSITKTLHMKVLVLLLNLSDFQNALLKGVKPGEDILVQWFY